MLNKSFDTDCFKPLLCVQCESRLLQHPGQRSGLLNEIEFTEALETLLPLTSDQLRRRLYLQSQANMPKGLEAVPISRLSRILNTSACVCVCVCARACHTSLLSLQKKPLLTLVFFSLLL